VAQSELKENSCIADSNSKRVQDLQAELAEMEDYHYNELNVNTFLLLSYTWVQGSLYL